MTGKATTATMYHVVQYSVYAPNVVGTRKDVHKLTFEDIRCQYARSKTLVQHGLDNRLDDFAKDRGREAYTNSNNLDWPTVLLEAD